jgi:hypothetical protein
MDPARLPRAPHPLAPGPQTACYLPWLKDSVALRYVTSVCDKAGPGAYLRGHRCRTSWRAEWAAARR